MAVWCMCCGKKTEVHESEFLGKRCRRCHGQELYMGGCNGFLERLARKGREDAQEQHREAGKAVLDRGWN